MSSIRFRQKPLDNNKELQVFREKDLPEEVVADKFSIMRSVPALPTGMEKEEEEEEHLKQIMDQQSRKGALAQLSIDIPIPEVEKGVELYKELYKVLPPLPEEYVKQQFLKSLDPQPPDYDMDSDDEAFLEEYNKSAKKSLDVDEFERRMYIIESNYPVSIDYLVESSSISKEEIEPVFNHYLKRLRELKTNIIMPRLKAALPDNLSQNDPYVCFRRRVERIQTRKNRSQQSIHYMNMLKMQRDLIAFNKLLGKLSEREKAKEDVIDSHVELFRKRCQLRDWDGTYYNRVMNALHRPPTPPQAEKEAPIVIRIPVSNTEKKKGKRDLPSTPSSSPKPKKKKKKQEDEEDMMEYVDTSAVTDSSSNPENPFRFRRRASVRYHAPLDDVSTSSMYHHPYTFFKESCSRGGLRGFCRRRYGRGGRVVVERCHPAINSRCDLSPTNTSSYAYEMHDPNVLRQLLYFRPSNLTTFSGVGGGILDGLEQEMNEDEDDAVSVQLPTMGTFSSSTSTPTISFKPPTSTPPEEDSDNEDTISKNEDISSNTGEDEDGSDGVGRTSYRTDKQKQDQLFSFKLGQHSDTESVVNETTLHTNITDNNEQDHI
eukprot:m.60474 g.60474  ORF g.60474 m.60474 type:complete len:600 (+) comp7946_c0_seq1:376-2175(+)